MFSVNATSQVPRVVTSRVLVSCSTLGRVGIALLMGALCLTYAGCADESGPTDPSAPASTTELTLVARVDSVGFESGQIAVGRESDRFHQVLYVSNGDAGLTFVKHNDDWTSFEVSRSGGLDVDYIYADESGGPIVASGDSLYFMSPLRPEVRATAPVLGGVTYLMAAAPVGESTVHLYGASERGLGSTFLVNRRTHSVMRNLEGPLAWEKIQYGLARGTLLYVADAFGSSVSIYDARDPESPVRLHQISSGPVFTVKDRYLYTASESSFEVYDVANPYYASLVSELSWESRRPHWMVHLDSRSGDGSWILVFDDTVVTVVDISDPTQPSPVDSFPVFGDGRTIRDVKQSRFSMFSHIYISDSDGGLNVFRPE